MAIKVRLPSAKGWPLPSWWVLRLNAEELRIVMLLVIMAKRRHLTASDILFYCPHLTMRGLVGHLQGIRDKGVLRVSERPGGGLMFRLCHRPPPYPLPPTLCVGGRGTVGASPKPRQSFIYFMRSLKHSIIKIGYSIHPKWRKSQIEEDLNDDIEILAVINGGRHKERELHEQFANSRTVHPAQKRVREWFEPSGELMEFIKGIK